MKAYNAAQASWSISQIPLSLTVSNSLQVQKRVPHTADLDRVSVG